MVTDHDGCRDLTGDTAVLGDQGNKDKKPAIFRREKASPLDTDTITKNTYKPFA